MGFIYYFENLINHKKYVGQTTRNPQVRYAQHFTQIDDGTVFHNALKKYGRENFLFYVIGEFPDNQLNEMERFYIKKFNTHWKDGYGYNMSYGGQNSPDATYRKVRAYPLNEDRIPIYELGRIFKSMTEACKILTEETGHNFTVPNLIAICQGKRYSVFDYTFCYIDDNNGDIPTGYNGYISQQDARRENIKKCHEATSIPIVLYAPWGESYYYPSIKEAGRDNHMCTKTIKKILDNHSEILAGPHKGWRAEYQSPQMIDINSVKEEDE